jgi:hypothetical protein
MSDLTKNYITAESKNCKDSTQPHQIQINLSDNCKEVRGFGQPIPVGLTKLMAKKYWESFDDVQDLLKFIDSDDSGILKIIKKDSKRSKQLEKLKMIMDPNNHIVSGVFGKEIILQTLSQKNCEGIRYIVGRDMQNKMTIMLAGVKETEHEKDEDNYTTKTYQGETVKVRKSELLPDANYIKNIKEGQASDPNDPTHPEVHVSSLTIAELKKILDANKELYENENDVLFGEF